MKLNHR